MKPFLIYFGCWGKSGHYLWRRDGSHVRDMSKEFGARLPADHTLDGGKLFLPFPEQVGKGALTHVISGEHAYTVLAWWDRTFDSRTGCNSAILGSGWDTAEELWGRFTFVYAELAKQLKMPELVS